MSDVVYRGVQGWRVTLFEGGVAKPLPQRQDLRNHSPDGFAWGYGGSGPAQLALAICAHALRDDPRAMRIYQEFKWRFVATLSGDRAWQISRTAVVSLCDEIDGAAAAQRAGALP